MGETYAAVDRVPDGVRAEVEGAMDELVAVKSSVGIWLSVQVGTEGTDEDGGKENTVATDEGAVPVSALLPHSTRALADRILVDTAENARHLAGSLRGWSGERVGGFRDIREVLATEARSARASSEQEFGLIWDC